MTDEEKTETIGNDYADKYAKLGAQLHSAHWSAGAKTWQAKTDETNSQVIAAIGKMLAVWPPARQLWRDGSELGRKEEIEHFLVGSETDSLLEQRTDDTQESSLGQ